MINASSGKIYDDVVSYFFNDKEKIALERNVKLHYEKIGLKNSYEPMFILLKNKILKTLKRMIHNNKDSWIRSKDECD